MMKTKFWAAGIVVFLLAAVIVCAVLYTRPAPGTVAVLYRDGERIDAIDLSLVTEAYEFTLTDERGSNTIRVEPGRIAVVAADCPDGVCVAHGWAGDSASPIVCLPHRLVIRLEAGDGDSAVMPDSVSR